MKTNIAKYVLLSALIMILLSGTSIKAQTVQIKVDATSPGKPLKHVWNYWGYDECNFTYTQGSQKLMQTLSASSKDAPYLRCHFLLNTGDGTPALKWGSTNAYTEDENGRPVYEWTIMDKIMDATVENGCLPLVEIGFMPKALSTNPEPYQHTFPPDVWAGWAYPPTDYDKWAGLMKKWAEHSKERYGSSAEEKWLWELWNEPDIFYWQGNFQEYCKLFDYTEKAIHEVMPKAVFGGPHTTSPAFRRPGRYLRRFLEHCATGDNNATGQTGTRLDYVGFHSKGSTSMAEGHPRVDLGLNLRNNRSGFQIVSEFEQYRNTPIIIGECDPEGAAALSSTVHPANGYRNSSYYAAYEVAMMKHTIDLAEQAGVNLRGVLTWAFMFDGKLYFEGFRTLSTNGLDKPVLNGFKLLNMLGGKRVPLTSSGALGVERIIEEKVRNQPDIDGLATASDEIVQVILWNYHDDITDGEPNMVSLEIQLPSNNTNRARVTHYRIDKNHSNAYTKWLSMGSPQSETSLKAGPQEPTAEQLVELKKSARLELLEPVKYVNIEDGTVKLDFEMPRHSVSLVEVRTVQ